MRDTIRLELVIDGLSNTQSVSCSGANLIIRAINNIEITHSARNTLGDLDKIVIGTLDPYRIGEISNV